jgi:glutaredoxin
MPNHFYTEPGCAACKDAKEFLISRGIPFEERDIHANPEYFRILTEELDSRTTPTFVFGDQIIVGFDQDEYQRLPGPIVTKRDRQAFRGSV